MEPVSLFDLGIELLQKAQQSSSGRAARSLTGGDDRAVHQTLLGLLAGHELGEHASPGEATLLVLRGRVELTSPETSWVGSAGELAPIPPSRHGLKALDDSVVLLSVVRPQTA